MDDKDMTELWKRYQNASPDQRDEIFELFRKQYTGLMNYHSRWGTEDYRQAALEGLHLGLLEWSPQHEIQPIGRFLWNQVRFAMMAEKNKIAGFNVYLWNMTHNEPKFLSVNYQHSSTSDSGHWDYTEYSGDEFENFLTDHSPSALDKIIEAESKIEMSPLLKMYFEEKRSIDWIFNAKLFKMPSKYFAKGWKWANHNHIRQLIIDDINALGLGEPITKLPKPPRGNKRALQLQWQRNNRDKVAQYYQKHKNDPAFVKNRKSNRKRAKMITWGTTKIKRKKRK